MSVRVPIGLAAEITSIELTVYDADASCTAPDVLEGSSLGTYSLQLGVPKSIKVSPGVRVFSAVAFEERTPVARGCDEKTLSAGGTASVMIDLVAFPGPPDAGPDAPPPDAPPPPPLNDNCSNEATIAAGTPRSDSTLGAADDETGTCAGEGDTPDVLYAYTLTGARRVHLEVTTDYDAAVSLRAPDCVDEQDESACVDAVVGDGVETIDVRNQPAGTYHVIVDGVGGARGDTQVLLTTAAPPPAGDSCAEAQALAAGTTVDQPVGESYADDDSGSCGGDGRDRVFQFPLASARQVDIATHADFAHVIYLRSGSCDGGVERACVESVVGGGGHDATMHFDTLPSGVYYLFVDAVDPAATGTVDLTLTLSTSATPPPNDDCDDATMMVEGLTALGTLEAATHDRDTACVLSASRDVYFKFTLATPRSIVIHADSSFDISLGLRTADCSTETTCVDASAEGEELSLGFLAAGTYNVSVVSATGEVGDFTIGYTTAPPRPSNDACGGVITMVPGVPRTGQVITDALDDADGSCGDDDNPDVVYRFSVFDAPARVRAVVTSDGFDPLLHLRSAACDGTEVGCAQTTTGDAEILDLPSVPPAVYYLWVEAQGGGSGTFTVQVDVLPEVPPPGNDVCSGADDLTAGTPVEGSTIGAIDDYAPSCLVDDGRDTVHQISLASAQSVLVTLTPDDPAWNLALAMRSSANCEAGPDLSCVPPGELPLRINRPNLAMGDYDLVVDGAMGASGDYSIEYAARAVDPTFGYWMLDGTDPFVPLTGATSVAIDLGGPINSLSDEGFYSIPIPFDFPFYGTTYTTIFAHVNMFLTFATPPSGSEAYINDCPLTSSLPNDQIALFWTDGYADDVAPVAQLLYKADGVAPYRTLTIEYRNFDVLICPGGLCSAVGARVNQQLVLHEDGDLELRYGPRTPPPELVGCGSQHTGCAATVGIEGHFMAGVDVDQVQCNAGGVVDGRVIRYVYPR